MKGSGRAISCDCHMMGSLNGIQDSVPSLILRSIASSKFNTPFTVLEVGVRGTAAPSRTDKACSVLIKN